MFLQHALNAARLTRGSEDDKPWYDGIMHNEFHFARSWGQDSIITAEAVLISTCTLSDLSLLATAPDSLFALVTCATAFMLMAKFRAMQHYCVPLEGASDSLLAKIIDCLSTSALSPEHFPAKCAQLITTWVKKCEQDTNPSGHPSHAADASASQEDAPNDANTFHTSQSGPDTVFGANDFIHFMTPDIYFDVDFWTSFMENVSTPDN